MRIEEKHQATYRLNKVFLKQSIFNWKDYNILPTELNFGLGMGKNVRNDSNEIESIIEINITESNGSENFNAKVQMVGVFEKFKEDNEEMFFKINAPSIVYPYLRQHIRSISLEAGLNPIIIPTVNFVEIAKELDKMSE